MDIESKWLDSPEIRSFLMSNTYKQRLRDIAYGMAGERIKLVFFTDSEELGYSGGEVIHVNLFPTIFSNCTLKELYVYHIALIVHEYSHNLYTAFRFVREIQGMSTSKMILKDIFNLIEDARIERISSYKLPGYADALYALNLAIYKNQRSGGVDDAFSLMRSSLWNYALLGITPTSLPENMLDDWSDIHSITKGARLEDKCERCFEASKKIALILEKYLTSEYQQMNTGLKNYEGFGQGRDANLDNSDDISRCNNDSGDKAQDSMKIDTGDRDSASGSTDLINDEITTVAQIESQIQDFISDCAEALFSAESEYKSETEKITFDTELLHKCIEENKPFLVNFAAANDECMNKYNSIKSRFTQVSSNMKRKLTNILRYNEDECNHKQSRGKVDAKSLCNIINGRICSTYKEKSEETNLNITFLLDKSGSMSGRRAELTLAACIIMSEALEQIKVPYSVLSFGNDVTIYKHWKQKQKTKKYSTANYTIGGSTKLAQALMVVKKSFVDKQKSSDKMIFVITDGSPDNIEAARSNVKILQRESQVYGIGIGDTGLSKELFVSLFGEEYFVYVEELVDLPAELTKIIKRNLLRKE